LRALVEVTRVLGLKLHLLLFFQFLVMELVVVSSGSLILGVHDFYDSIIGDGNSIIVSSVSVAPFTSIVDVGQLQRRLENVEVELEERVYAVVRFGNNTALLVGLDEKMLRELSSSKPCGGCVLVGEELAHELRISPETDIVVYSPYTSLPYVLHVWGLAKGWPYSRMLISDLAIARSIRGLSDSQSSIVILRFKGDAKTVLDALGVSSYGRSIEERVFLAVTSADRNLSGKLYSAYAGEVLDRLNIPEGVFYVVLLAVCISLSISASALGGFLLYARSKEIEILRISGISFRAIKCSLIVIMLFYSLLGGLLSCLILPLVPVKLRILGLELGLSPSPGALATGLLLWIFASLSLAGGNE